MDQRRPRGKRDRTPREGGGAAGRGVGPFQIGKRLKCDLSHAVIFARRIGRVGGGPDRVGLNVADNLAEIIRKLHRHPAMLPPKTDKGQAVDARLAGLGVDDLEAVHWTKCSKTALKLPSGFGVRRIVCPFQK